MRVPSRVGAPAFRRNDSNQISLFAFLRVVRARSGTRCSERQALGAKITPVSSTTQSLRLTLQADDLTSRTCGTVMRFSFLRCEHCMDPLPGQLNQHTFCMHEPLPRPALSVEHAFRQPHRLSLQANQISLVPHLQTILWPTTFLPFRHCRLHVPGNSVPCCRSHPPRAAVCAYDSSSLLWQLRICLYSHSARPVHNPVRPSAHVLVGT